MSKIKLFFKNHLGVAMISCLALITLAIGITFSFTIITLTYLNEKLYLKELCLYNTCIESWINYNSSAFEILGITGKLIAGLVTIGGILVAVASYQNSVKTSDLTNHLSHMSIFINYIHGEIDKRPRLAKAEIDILKWYNLIYLHAETGKFDISESYQGAIKNIRSQIIESNRLYQNTTSDIYLYKNHQTKIIEIMSHVGATMHRLPRLDFHEAEGQLLDLISTVNRSFCRSLQLDEFPDRNYK